jgi:hypothetical protein
LLATPVICFEEDGSRGGRLQLASGVALTGTEDRVLSGGGGSTLAASLEPDDGDPLTPPAQWCLAWQDAEQSRALIASGLGPGVQGTRRCCGWQPCSSGVAGVRAVGGSCVELQAARWKSTSDRWTPRAAAGSMTGGPHGGLFPICKINSEFKFYRGKNR